MNIHIYLSLQNFRSDFIYNEYWAPHLVLILVWGPSWGAYLLVTHVNSHPPTIVNITTNGGSTPISRGKYYTQEGPTHIRF